MTQEHSDIENLLDAISIGEGADLILQLAQWALQHLIDAEATESIGSHSSKAQMSSSMAALGLG